MILPRGLCPLPMSLDQFLVDDRDLGGGARVGIRERASVQDANAERSEVVACHDAILNRGQAAHVRRQGPVVEGEVLAPDLAHQRQAVDRTDGLRSWNRAHALDDVCEEPDGACVCVRREFTLELRIDVFPRGQIDLHRQYAFGIECGLHAQEPVHALDHQSGANEQHERQGDLGHQQPSAKPAATSAIGGAARALLQTSVYVGGDGVARGCQAEQDARRSRHEKRESQHARIDPDVGGAREHLAADQIERVGGRVGGGETEKPTCQRQGQTLREELPEQPCARGAERQAYRDFPPPNRGARQ